MSVKLDLGSELESGWKNRILNEKIEIFLILYKKLCLKLSSWQNKINLKKVHNVCKIESIGSELESEGTKTQFFMNDFSLKM